ncbi:hypothetical protein Y032_0073g796 [Ancylostoma ceylanicum]|nr:hypothetical protein Y032_0073g796 [Ancylostoma ceylanicum]
MPYYTKRAAWHESGAVCLLSTDHEFAAAMLAVLNLSSFVSNTRCTCRCRSTPPRIVEHDDESAGLVRCVAPAGCVSQLSLASRLSIFPLHRR